ncbi:MAG TPA: hypothetical protein VJV04_03100 [Nitrospiraceae bacterium]|nr:hypothetical protein [Nitrospiraceae bacterium]
MSRSLKGQVLLGDLHDLAIRSGGQEPVSAVADTEYKRILGTIAWCRR